MTTRTCDGCYSGYDDEDEGADGLCEQCYGDPFEDDTEDPR